MQAPDDPDAAIRATDNDASLARLSAVQKGYLTDAFVAPFVHRPHLQPPRPPLINIGTFVRSHAIDALVNNFIDTAGKDGRKAQIVSFGAGSDTRFWRIASSPLDVNVAKYVEFDFPEVTAKKAMAIRKNKQLNALLGKASEVSLAHGGTALHSPKYHLLGCDLRLPPQDTLPSFLPIISPTIPTLLLFECVLVYMTPAASSTLLAWLVGHFSGTTLGCIIYEMFGLEDSFGRVMKSNLQVRNISLPGAIHTTTSALEARLRGQGFSSAKALTLKAIRSDYIDRAELTRISHLEMLDEVEELELVLEHYAISWGVRYSFPHPATETETNEIGDESRSGSKTNTGSTAEPDPTPTPTPTGETQGSAWEQWAGLGVVSRG